MLQGSFLITQAAARSMVQNQVHNGSIVHISSIVAKVNLSCTLSLQISLNLSLIVYIWWHFSEHVISDVFVKFLL